VSLYRLRLVSLWVSQTARVLADWCLRMAAAAALLGGGNPSGWQLATAVFITPFILLSPLNGVLANGLPRRRVLVASAAFSLIAVACCVALHASWLVCLGVAALGTAVYSPVRYAVLPAAALDTRFPLPRISGWIEMGGSAAIVLGALLGASASGESLATILLGLNAVCLVTALPVAFPSDVIRPEPPGRAVAGFFADCGRILRDREARSSVLGLAAFQAVVTAGSGALLAPVLTGVEFSPADLFRPMLLVGGGAAVGCAAAALQGHPRRCLGLVPLGATGLLLALIWASLAGDARSVPCFLLGFMGGLVNVPLRAVYLAAVPADARGNATSAMNTTIYAATTALAVILLALIVAGPLAAPAAQLAALAALTAAGVGVAWVVLYPQAMEVVVEVAMLPIYRVRGHGPGAGRLPARGPLLIVANHSAYLDPFWVAKLVPRQIRPMMTAAFYDRPGVRWLSYHVARAIRVPYGSFRREAPELQEAIAALRAGESVVIFPEAMLRRTEDVLLRPFGRGVWNILHELPETPVCLCWIEGGWGSYFSYKDGEPSKNKRPDRGRPIDIAFNEPHPLDPAVLANHRATRKWLRKEVLQCRAYLGLPVPPLDDGPTGDADEPAAGVQPGGRSSSN
jgi:1-acyl-sn-glycerol-3-phosphate acyltransferase/MFS family permease